VAFTLREDLELQMFENIVVWKIFGYKEDEGM
jgi:hypothetical protein